MRTHQCPGPGCVRRVPFDRLACPRHWFQVSHELRVEVWRAFRSLQRTVVDDPTLELEAHADACRRAIAEMHA